MKSKKYKTRDEWKALLNDLSPEQFQDLCYDIVKGGGFGFVNPQFRGKGGDGGRDITVEFEYLLGGESKRDACWIQAKRQKSGVNFGQISTEVVKAQDQGVKKFFIASNADTTPDCKDDISNWNAKNRCEIHDWSGTKFLDLLFGLPHICEAYFPDEEIPPLVDKKNPQTLVQQSEDLGRQFGIELKLPVNKEINLNNPHEVADVLKEALVGLGDLDVNLRALLYQKVSMFFFSLEKSEDALMFLDKSLEITPRNTEALLNKGYILEKIHEVEESNKCYDAVLDIEQQNKFALNNKAHNLRRQGKLETALILVEKALTVDKKFIVAIQTKIEILKVLDRPEDALHFLESKEAEIEKSLGLKQLKVDVLIALLDLKTAFELNEQVLTEDPENINALNNRGVIYEKNSKHQYREKYLKLALECFQGTVGRDKKYHLGWSNSAVVYMNAGQLELAQKVLDEAHTFFPKSAVVLNKKGVLLLKKGNASEALKYFNKALQLHYEEEFLINRARAYLALRQWQKARKDANKVLSISEKSSNAWIVMADASKQLHETSKAVLYKKKANSCVRSPLSLLED